MIVEKARILRAYIPKPVCFTNGCFDLLVPQHARLLRKCASYGTVVVSVNSDSSVRALKGPDRPIMEERDRLELVEALLGGIHFSLLNFCFLDDALTPLDSILHIRPKFLVKGDEYHEADIVGAAEVRSWGGQVIRFPGSLTSLHSQDVIVKCRATGAKFPAAARSLE